MSRGMIISIPRRPCKHNLYFFYRYNGFIQASLRSKPSIHIGIIKINNTNIKVSNNERIARHSTKILIFNIKIEKILCCNSMAFQSFFVSLRSEACQFSGRKGLPGGGLGMEKITDLRKKRMKTFRRIPNWLSNTILLCSLLLVFPTILEAQNQLNLKKPMVTYSKFWVEQNAKYEASDIMVIHFDCTIIGSKDRYVTFYTDFWNNNTHLQRTDSYQDNTHIILQPASDIATYKNLIIIIPYDYYIFEKGRHQYRGKLFSSSVHKTNRLDYESFPEKQFTFTYTSTTGSTGSSGSTTTPPPPKPQPTNTQQSQQQHGHYEEQMVKCRYCDGTGGWKPSSIYDPEAKRHYEEYVNDPGNSNYWKYKMYEPALCNICSQYHYDRSLEHHDKCSICDGKGKKKDWVWVSE